MLKETRHSLRSPNQASEIFGGDLPGHLGLAAPLMAAAAATGHAITYPEALLGGGGSLVVGGPIPTLGGIGVADGALAAGLIPMRLPAASAVTAGLILRAFGVYPPPFRGLIAPGLPRKFGLL